MTDMSFEVRCGCGAEQRVGGLTMSATVAHMIALWDKQHAACRKRPVRTGQPTSAEKDGAS